MAHQVNLENIEKYLKTRSYPDEYAGLFYYAIDVCFIPLKTKPFKPSEWPYVIEGVLFAHRVSKHSSTKF